MAATLPQTPPEMDSVFRNANSSDQSANTFASTENEQKVRAVPNFASQKEAKIDAEKRNTDSLRGVEEKCFLLLDEKENLQVEDAQDFENKLHSVGQATKVVSIFGNTGDGKSHTLNNAFFDGKEIFKTSASQLSCTVGIWAAYEPNSKMIVLDTEGLLGTSSNSNQRMRLLLKVFAVSDVIIYRTRAERLHTDMFTFLGDASEAYMKHFSQELKEALKRCNMNVPLCTLGPALIIFHETIHTDLLGTTAEETNGKGIVKTANDILKERFADVGRIPQAFSCIKYVGTRTVSPPTDFTVLQRAVREHLRDSSVRSSKHPGVIFKALMHLNKKFSGDIIHAIANTFPDEYFTCTATCLSCNSRCCESMNHEQDDTAHTSLTGCVYHAQYDNKFFTCKSCYERGKQTVVIPKTCSSSDASLVGLAMYAWAGYVLECPECGVIYRSREHWFGNRTPEECAVRTELKHIWPGESNSPHDTSNVGRRLLDGFSYVTDAMSTLGAPPSRAVSSWIADQVNPAYWKPNSQITSCQACQHAFTPNEKKHHCRACGGGFCDACSSKRRSVQGLGWGETPVRVCNECYDTAPPIEREPEPQCNLGELADAMEDLTENRPSTTLGRDSEDNCSQPLPLPPFTARKVTEAVQSAVGAIATAMDYPRELITDAARPSYWVPDIEIHECFSCKKDFKLQDYKHHCRECGQGVCSSCSQNRRPVPSRGWDHPVRICDKCVAKKEQL